MPPEGQCTGPLRMRYAPLALTNHYRTGWWPGFYGIRPCLNPNISIRQVILLIETVRWWK